MYRNTYAEINLNNIRKNVENLISKYNCYDYYFGVVKADSYGHDDIKVVKEIIKAGCNYLAVATLDEALEIRREIRDIPILCLGIISLDYIDICIKNNITITIDNYDYLKEVVKEKYGNIKIHIKLNTGMNRLGIKDKKEFTKTYDLVKKNNLLLEGIYTHIYNSSSKKDTLKQFEEFKKIISNIDLNEVPIIHIGASDVTINYTKPSFVNGCRLEIGMYGLLDSNIMNFLSTFSLYSEVIKINDVWDETVGYNGAYKAVSNEQIAVVSIGYADGIIRKNTGRYVYINDKKYNIVGNICMDMLFVKVDDKVKVGDKVVIIKNIDHIKYIANYLDTITYEVICSIGKRVPRIYV